MTSSQRVLQVLGTRLGKVSVKEIQEAACLTKDQAYSAVAVLVRRGYAQRRGEGHVKATAEGLKFLQRGEQVHHGPKGPQVLEQDGTSLRSRLWRAIRLLHKATVREVLELAERGDEGNAASNAKDYLNILVRSGHLTRMSRPGTPEPPATTPPSRYCLLRDSGPLAPQWNKRQRRVFDPNTRETFDVA